MKMKQNTNDFLQKVLAIINSSDRKMPAHFTSNGSRTQSFCVDFDISEADEYAMASEAWYSATDLSIVMIGEDIMLGAYIATLLEEEKYIPQICQMIVGINVSVLSAKSAIYFQQCAKFGNNCARI